ncbi:hypothetical protein MM239_07115 [Belliella sp. DSM 111904]|uniref:Outer membrane protein beta-barrel domain-containing protein n=1 Tax=Belliella filtrata TaxID=2923435 RepID=A0ABS9UYC2_9BACT|nr:hypothetical protein [Belliella filtrata]MCH7409157.1 hypothetical protein [Belliella filtrata]
MKRILIISLLSLLMTPLHAQLAQKNNIYVNYANVTGDRTLSGSFLGHGYAIGYSRYLKPRLYADISVGRLDYEGKQSPFFLTKDETGRFDMAFFTLGFGYDLVQREKFILSAEGSYLRISNTMLMSQIESNGLTIREISRSPDVSARVGIKAKFFVNDHVQVSPSASYGFAIENFRTIWLNLGIGYSF